MAKVTLGVQDRTLDELIFILKSLQCEILDQYAIKDDFHDKTKIMINGNWVAFTDKGPSIVSVLK